MTIDVGVNPLAHADDGLGRVPQCLIKSLHTFVERMNLQIDLDAAKVRKSLFCVPDQCCSQSFATLVRGNCNRIQSAAMAVVTGKNGPGHAAVHDGDEKQPVPDSQFLVDRQLRTVMRHGVIEDGLPQFDDGKAVMRV